MKKATSILLCLLVTACGMLPSEPAAPTIDLAAAVKQTIDARDAVLTTAPIPATVESIEIIATAPAIPTAPPEPTRPIPTEPMLTKGSFNQPVKSQEEYRFPGFGTMTVLESRWKPGVTGLAIVRLYFVCERPADQTCDTGDFMFDAVGGSGNGYRHEIDSSVPDPWFGSFSNPVVYGGGEEIGYIGFLITKSENTLKMIVKLFLKDDKVYFDITP